MNHTEISVTRQFRKYRDLLRYSWNTLVADDEEMVRSFGVFDIFNVYRASLFKLIFYEYLPESSDDWIDLKDLGLMIRAPETHVFISYDETTRCVDPSKHIPIPVGSTVKPLTFYDLGNMGCWDLQYVEVVVVESSNEKLIGEHALVESRWIEVMKSVDLGRPDLHPPQTKENK